jgi:WhiB family redox-sensing transcriptional regulator
MFQKSPEDPEYYAKDPNRNWMSQANCMGVDPDLFFPERGESVKEAKEVCATCIVKQRCLEYALDNNEKFGIWGGSSERERRRMRKQRALNKVKPEID